MQFDTFRNEAGLNRFTMTPSKWIESTQAIGIVSNAGRYGGTYAYYGIAMSLRLDFLQNLSYILFKIAKNLKNMKTKNYH